MLLEYINALETYTQGEIYEIQCDLFSFYPSKIEKKSKRGRSNKKGEKYNCPNCPTQLMCSIHKIKEAVMLIKQREREKAGIDRKMCRFVSISIFIHT